MLRLGWSSWAFPGQTLKRESRLSVKSADPTSALAHQSEHRPVIAASNQGRTRLSKEFLGKNRKRSRSIWQRCYSRVDIFLILPKLFEVWLSALKPCGRTRPKFIKWNSISFPNRRPNRLAVSSVLVAIPSSAVIESTSLKTCCPGDMRTMAWLPVCTENLNPDVVVMK